MNKASHILMGRILCRHLSASYGITLDEKSFLLGNILPDLGIRFLFKPHTLGYSRKHTVKLIKTALTHRKTSASFGKRTSQALGVLCHYYADFFCYAHNGAFSVDLAAHVKYENELHRALQRGGDSLRAAAVYTALAQEVTTERVFSAFLAHHEDYLAQLPSFFNDVSHCLTACTEALVLITTAALEEELSPGGLLVTA